MTRFPEPAPRRFCLAEKDLPGALTGAVSGFLSETDKPAALIKALVDYTASDGGAIFGNRESPPLVWRGVREPVSPNPSFWQTLTCSLGGNFIMVHGGEDGPDPSLLLFPDSRSALVVPVSLSGNMVCALLNSVHTGWFTPAVIRFAESMKIIVESWRGNGQGG